MGGDYKHSKRTRLKNIFTHAKFAPNQKKKITTTTLKKVNMAAILGINFRSYLDVNVKIPIKTDTTSPTNIRRIISPVSFSFVATPIGSNKNISIVTTKLTVKKT